MGLSAEFPGTSAVDGLLTSHDCGLPMLPDVDDVEAIVVSTAACGGGSAEGGWAKAAKLTVSWALAEPLTTELATVWHHYTGLEMHTCNRRHYALLLGMMGVLGFLASRLAASLEHGAPLFDSDLEFAPGGWHCRRRPQR
jgi:hypothetical protein